MRLFFVNPGEIMSVGALFPPPGDHGGSFSH